MARQLRRWRTDHINVAMHEVVTEIEIEATPERVWDILLDFPSHPEWNPFIRSIQGVAKVGDRLTVSIQPRGAKAMTFRPVRADRDTQFGVASAGEPVDPGNIRRRTLLSNYAACSWPREICPGRKVFGRPDPICQIQPRGWHKSGFRRYESGAEVSCGDLTDFIRGQSRAATEAETFSVARHTSASRIKSSSFFFSCRTGIRDRI